MSVSYFKRFRMEVDLARITRPPALPNGYHWVGWNNSLIDQHAAVKYRCFENELDSRVFPCLADLSGCEQLMREIVGRKGFLAEATWLIAGPDGYVGTVQGVAYSAHVGMIQNLGVVTSKRGLGLGRCLLLQALAGFRCFGLTRGMLEVTAANTVAIKLYRRIGFRRARTFYKAVEVVEPVGAGSC